MPYSRRGSMRPSTSRARRLEQRGRNENSGRIVKRADARCVSDPHRRFNDVATGRRWTSGRCGHRAVPDWCMVPLHVFGDLYRTVFAKHKGPGVLAVGIVAHAFLLGFVVVGFVGRNSAPEPSCALAVVYAGLWIGMYSRLLHGQAYKPPEI